MASEKAIYDYKGVLADFSDEIQDWLMDIYLEHGNQVEKRLRNILKQYSEYLLAVSEEDYKCIANEIFPPLVDKLPYLKDDEEKLFELLKQLRRKFSTYVEYPNICESFNDWIDETKEKYGVDLVVFADVYVTWWSRQEKLWERKCKTYTKEYDTYYYDWRLAKDPFGLDSFYLKNQIRPFIEGHKRDLEMLFVYLFCYEPWFKWQKPALKDYIEKFLKKGNSEPITYKEAAAHELGNRWKALINEHPDDASWKVWKDEFIGGNIDGTMRTFLAFAGDKIVGDATLKLENSELFALRINSEYQGRGIASGFVKYIESWAIKNGFKHLQIAVEPNQVRNMQIFFHWGYNQFVSNDNDILAYRKLLIHSIEQIENLTIIQ